MATGTATGPAVAVYLLGALASAPYCCRMARTTFGIRFKKGDQIGGRYEVLRKLGEGGAGAVYHCRDLRRGAGEVAVKVLENQADHARFRREGRLMQRVRHRHVVALLDRGMHDQRWPYLVLEYMNGGSVRDLLDRRKKLDVVDAAWLIIQTIRGLKAARTVHRDLKPENLLLNKGNKGTGLSVIAGDVEAGATIKVSDFGLAKSREEGSVSLTNTGQVMGTPVYMSPEQCRSTKRVSIKTDVYALGILLYEMVMGKPPFDASNVYDIMAMQCEKEPDLRRVPAALRDIIRTCLAKKPQHRYPTLAALERDLGVVAGTRVRREEDTGGAWWVWILVVLLVAGVGLALGWERLRHWLE